MVMVRFFFFFFLLTSCLWRNGYAITIIAVYFALQCSISIWLRKHSSLRIKNANFDAKPNTIVTFIYGFNKQIFMGPGHCIGNQIIECQVLPNGKKKKIENSSDRNTFLPKYNVVKLNGHQNIIMQSKTMNTNLKTAYWKRIRFKIILIECLFLCTTF